MALEAVPRRVDTTVSRPPEDSLTAEYAAELLFYSFRFSQGNASLHMSIFGFLHAIHPNWTMDVAMRDRVLESIAPRIRKFLQPKITPSGTKISHFNDVDQNFTYNIRESVDMMRNTLNSDPRDADREPLENEIARGIIKQDHWFLCEVRGKDHKIGRDRQGVNPNTPEGNPWLSHAVYYAIEGHSTGIPEYDQMFARVRGVIEASPFSGNSREQLSDVTVAHRQKGFTPKPQQLIS